MKIRLQSRTNSMYSRRSIAGMKDMKELTKREKGPPKMMLDRNLAHEETFKGT